MVAKHWPMRGGLLQLTRTFTLAPGGGGGGFRFGGFLQGDVPADALVISHGQSQQLAHSGAVITQGIKVSLVDSKGIGEPLEVSYLPSKEGWRVR
eukprot:1489978-Amphidinium_carterae.2